MPTFLERILFPSKRLDEKKLQSAINGKTIIITGASSGIGRALAYLLAEFQVNLVLIARREHLLVEIKEDLEKSPATIQIISADLRREEDIKRTLQELQKLSIDVFVSNAGISINRAIFDSLDRFHDFTRTMAINYFAPVQLLLSLLPELQNEKGHIVNVSTINALLFPFPNWSAYQASKGAFDTWFRASMPELNKRGISTSTLYLPLVRTPMIEPTPAYRHTPAMRPEHVAQIIASMLYTKRRIYKPWWAIFGELGSLIFRGMIERNLAKSQKEEQAEHANKSYKNSL